METKILVNLNTIEKIVRFSKVVITFDSDIIIYQNSRRYNAKSILAIFSLNMTKPHYIEIQSEDEDEIKLFNKIAEEFK